MTGALARVQTSTAEMCAIALEWPDLDPRLGFRQLGGWGHKELTDIVVDAQSKLVAIRKSLESLPDHFPVALSLPTLPLPPLFPTPSWQLSESELHLRHAVDELALSAAGRPNIRFVRPQGQEMDARSPHASDFKGELVSGLPYSIAHADQVARYLAQLL